MNIQRFIIYIGFFCSSLLSFSQSAFYKLGESYAEDGNYAEAIRLTKKSLNLDIQKTDKYYEYIDYCALSEYFSYISQPDSCQKYVQNALRIWKDVEGLEYIAVLSTLSHSLLRAGFIQQALDFRNDIIKIVEQQYGIDSPRLLSEYRMLSIFYEKIGNNSMSVEYAKMEENLAYKTINVVDSFERCIPYEDSFQYLRYVIQDREEPIAGIHYLLNRLDVHCDAIDEENRVHTLNAIWAMSRDNDFIEGCIAVYKEQALHGTLKDKLTNLTNIYVEDSNIKNDVNAPAYAQTLYDLAMQDCLSQWFTDKEIDGLLTLLPSYYGEIGLIRHSYEMARKNYEWRKNNSLEMLFSDIKVLISASALEDEAQYAIELGESILNSHRYDDNMDVLYIIYEKMVEAYQGVGDSENAERYLAKIGKTDNFQILYSKAGIYLQLGDMKSLLPIALQLNENKDVPEKNRELVLWMLMLSARDAREDNILLNYANEYVSTYRKYLLNNFPLMSEEEQTNFICNSSYTSNLVYDFFIGLDKTDVRWSAAKEAYDYTLLKKNVLLTSQNDFRNAIKNSSDSLIRSKFNILQQQKNEFSLQNEILKRELIKYASQKSSYLEKLSYTWQNVRDALNEDEVAIEFVMCYNYYNLSLNSVKECNPIYLALIVRHDSEEPTIAVLSSAKKINDVNHDDILSINNLNIYNDLWKPLEAYLVGINKIFFSPVEKLNTIAIEYASMGFQRICDKWDIIRVSSTREVIDYREKPRRDNAVLFGGLRYELNREDLIVQSRTGGYHSTSPSRTICTDKMRYGVSYLPGTLTEVQEIAKLFPFTPNLLTGIFGTEESFKSLAESSVDIIHIATHGFFWGEDDAEKRNYVNFLRDIQFYPTSTEDHSMMRSGLLFSGANISLKGEDLPEDVEDGILTAKELSKMNLGNVDLVVMSACESGLGDISGEGVYGLQRGFKLAGTNTLLMSLWKVDDNATQLLMTEFYRYYLSGRSKCESLRLAQLTLRNSEKYSEPEYWAAFILLDALN